MLRVISKIQYCLAQDILLRDFQIYTGLGYLSRSSFCSKFVGGCLRTFTILSNVHKLSICDLMQVLTSILGLRSEFALEMF